VTWLSRALPLALLLTACTDPAETEPVPQGTLPPAVCGAGTHFDGTAPAFVDKTAEWGLEGVEGVRLSGLDVDADGLPDLVVRRGDNLADDFGQKPACCDDASCPMGTDCVMRRTWLMRNTGGKAFEDVTKDSKILTNRVIEDENKGRPGTVYAFADVDNDGDLDLYSGFPPAANVLSVETSELLLNQGDGTFVLGPEANHLRAPGAPAGATFVDIDRNGLVDLFVAHGGDPLQDHLFGGDGLGGFFDVTGLAGMITAEWNDTVAINEARAHSRAWSSLACDLNDDGNPELLAASYGRAPSHLWQATGAPPSIVYQNRSIASGYAFDDRVDWTDNESARCYCTLHPTADDCAGVPAPQYILCESDADAFRWNHPTDREPYRLGGNMGTTVCADVDNDGDMDLLVTSIRHWDVGSSSDPSELLINAGEPDVRLSRPGNEATGLTRVHEGIDWNDGDITAAIFDFDNDARQDVYIGSTDYPGDVALLWQQDATGHFNAVAPAVGLDHHRSHGVALADFDLDGDLDIVLGHSLSRCEDDCYETSNVRFFENQTQQAQGSNFLQVVLEGGPGTNRSAIGARVTVKTPDGVTQTQEVGGGHGHYGIQHDLALHFGLGTACEAEVTVRWPDAALTTETHQLVSGYRFKLAQGLAPAVAPAAAPEP
jgi:hypothetical protein